MLSDDQVSNELFQGIHFFGGVDYLPEDIFIDLNSIREWVYSSNLIYDKDQIMNEERISDLEKVFNDGDKLKIAIEITKDNDTLNYLEYPYIPIRTLIARKEKVKLVYWKVSGNEIKLGFWISSIGGEEFCSTSNSTSIVSKFTQKLDSLASTWPITTHPDGTREIVIEGKICALFSKEGRSFSVDLEH